MHSKWLGQVGFYWILTCLPHTSPSLEMTGVPPGWQWSFPWGTVQLCCLWNSPVLIVTGSVFQPFTSRSLWCFRHCSLNYSYRCNDFNFLTSFISCHLISCHYHSYLVKFVSLRSVFISFHERKFFISSKEMKSCNFNENQLGKVWSISLHFMSSHAIWCFSFCCTFFFPFKHLILSISSPVFLFDFIPWFCNFSEFNFVNFWSFSLHLISSQSIWFKSLHSQIFFFHLHFILSYLPSRIFVTLSSLISRFHC